MTTRGIPEFTIFQEPEDINSAFVVEHHQLDDVFHDYKNKTLLRSDNHFSETTWYIKNGDAKSCPLTFERYSLDINNQSIDLSLPKYRYLMLFFRVHAYHILKQESCHGTVLSAASVATKYNIGRFYLLPLLIKNNILVDLPHKPIKSFAHLSHWDISQLITDIAESQALTPDSQLDIFRNLALFLQDSPDIPGFFTSTFNPFSDNSPAAFVNGKLTKDGAKQDGQGFQPIPDSDFYWLGKSAMDFVHDHGATIVRIHEIVCETHQTPIPESCIDRSITEGKNIRGCHSNRLLNPTEYRLEKIAEQLIAEGVNLPSWSEEQCKYWNTPPAKFPNIPQYAALIRNGVHIRYFERLFALLFGASLVLIFTPTGIRASEALNIDEERVSDTPNPDGIYSLLNGIKKVPDTGRFLQENEIPIPFETWNAINVLGDLTKPRRDGEDQCFCVTPYSITGTFLKATFLDDNKTVEKWNGAQVFPTQLNSYLTNFAAFINCKTLPTTHRFRPTIANFFLVKTNYAPLLLQQLFGHRSIGMTLRYMHKNKLIKRAIAQRVTAIYSETVAELATAYVTGTLAGPMKQVFGTAIEARDEFKGLTEYELALGLAEWLLARMKSQRYLITHTPTNICCRAKTAHDSPPCHQEGCGHIDPEYPIPANCVGAECKWAAFTFRRAASIQQQLGFYKNVLKGVGPDIMQNQRLRDFASQYYETYDPVLKQIKMVPADEVETKMREMFGDQLIKAQQVCA
ncbi:site-specific integrase [Vibrio parahaemolyticus]|nr:site-specific integrase [Vibrio parahaemolyticus]